ncbi:MAG: DUF790 family protein [Pirellulaceae bacterium]
MLTRDQSVVTYESGLAIPDRLKRSTHRAYIILAQQMLRVYENGVGRTRRELHQSVSRVLQNQPDCPPRRVAAFCKLLDESATYIKDQRGSAAKLRQMVFRTAAPLHPLVTEADAWFEHEHMAAKLRIAEQLGMSWPDIERNLFSDVIEFHTLQEFSGYASAEDLLARYNVAQTQAALYDAVRLRVWAQQDFKLILRYAKLARLMHTIRRINPATYCFDFDGPTSVMTSSRRYGVNMAKFLPGLLSCRGWRLVAELRPPRWRGRVTLKLDSSDGLKSPVSAANNFDSDLEREFSAKWGDQPRNGWTLKNEADILHVDQKVFIPDFTLVHTSGQRVLLELVGFWTPEYIAQKLDTLKRFSQHPILLAVAESTTKNFSHLSGSETRCIIPFKRRLSVTAVTDCLMNSSQRLPAE